MEVRKRFHLDVVIDANPKDEELAVEEFVRELRKFEVFCDAWIEERGIFPYFVSVEEIREVDKEVA